jgi:uncharacterized protein
MKSRSSLVVAVCLGVLVVTMSTAAAQTPTIETTPAVPMAIPIFPLPSSVLFPDVSLPLRVFEPRYRAMIEAALQSDRIIGIVLLRPGFEADRDGNPPVYAIGTAALITSVEPLVDGRFNLVVRGLTKIRIRGEESSRPFRIAQVEPISETPDAAAAETLKALRPRLEHLLTEATGLSFADLGIAAASDSEAVNALAFYLDFDPLDSQGLLEQDGIVPRAESLIHLLETNGALPR